MSTSKTNRGRARGAIMGLAAVLGGLFLSGCAETAYLYRPAGAADATEAGVPAASYDIPPGESAGNVRVASLGVTELAIDDARVPVVRARMTLANTSDEAGWTVNTRDVQADFGGGAQGPAFANAEGGESLPVLTIARGQQRTLDLFYRLPDSMSDADSLPVFTLHWKVKTGTVEVAGNTTFERTEVDERAAAPVVAVAYAPYWWYDSYYYGRPTYIGAPWSVRPWYSAPVYSTPMYGGGYVPHRGGGGFPHRVPAMPHFGGMGGGGGMRGGGFHHHR